MRVDPEMLEFTTEALELLAMYQLMTNTSGFPIQAYAADTGYLLIKSLDYSLGIALQPENWQFRPEVLN